MGITALIMTVPNPYAVGDIGLLLSFSATFGILLWADKICIFLLGAFHIMPSLPLRKEKTRRAKCGNLLRRAARLLLSFLSTSLAATLWVIPLTVVFFGTITPLAVIISIVAYPLTCAVLLLGLLLVIAEGLWLTPIAAGLAMLLNLLSRALVGVVLWFARSPAADVSAEESFYLIWLVLTAALVAAGYLTHAGQRYVFSAILFSALVLTVGASVCCLCADDGAYLTVIRCGSGYTAAVGKGRNLSLLSCGGTQQAENEITELLRRADEVDTILLTGTDKRNTARLYAVMAESDVDTFVVSDKAEALLTVSQAAVVPYHDNTRLTVALNREVSVEVYCVGGLSYQYIRSPRYTVLLIPEKGEAEVLPQALRRADIVLLEGRASHLELLDCGKLYDRNNGSRTRCADHRAADFAAAAVVQHMRAFPEGIAGGDDVVDEQHALAANEGRIRNGEHAAHIFRALVPLECMLGRVLTDLHERVPVGQPRQRGALTRQQLRLIKPSAPHGRFVHGDAGDAVKAAQVMIGALRRGDDQQSQRLGIGAFPAELEALHRRRIRVPIGKRRAAGIIADGILPIGDLRQLFAACLADHLADGEDPAAERTARREE